MPFRVHAPEGPWWKSTRKAAIRRRAGLRAVLGRETVIGSVFKMGGYGRNCRLAQAVITISGIASSVRVARPIRSKFIHSGGRSSGAYAGPLRVT